MKDLNNQSLAALRSRLNEVKATQSSLQADLLRIQALPSSSEIKHAARPVKKVLTPTLQDLITKAAEVEERCILYRTAGWTVFEIDLDVGKRERLLRKERTIDGGRGKAALGLGVRLDTFYDGRFHQPFYLIFAKPSQLLQDNHNPAKSLRLGNKRRLRLIRHTIPHFIPLVDIVSAYLQPSIIDCNDERLEKEEGGFDLISNLVSKEGLEIFLSRVHTYLQSFISRREQVLSLQNTSIPGFLQSALRAFASESCGQLMIRWDLPSPSTKDVHSYKDRDEILHYTIDSPDSAQAGSLARSEGQVNVQLEISIVYHDLSSDQIGEPSEEVSNRRQMVEALGGDETPGLQCTYATILVESVHSRVPSARRGESQKYEKLQIRRKRRRDWEMLFTSSAGAIKELQETLGQVMEAAWREELQRVIVDL